jgi:signal transduction histidine kinase
MPSSSNHKRAPRPAQTTSPSHPDVISVLYVEDDKQTVDIMLPMLRLHYPGLIFYSANSGTQGFKVFLEYRPDIVITDIRMPKKSGLEMAAEIRAISEDTVIIDLTAMYDTQFLHQSIELGISNYITKPVDFTKLYTAIDKASEVITHQRQFRDQMNRANLIHTELTAHIDALESANHELEAFNYTVAHDLRSPLVGISGFVQEVSHQYDESLDSQGKQYLQTIHNETIRMNNLIDSLLKFSLSARKGITKTWVNLSEIANVTKENLLVRNPQRTVQFCIADKIMGFCDPVLIGNVMENLFENACKYTLPVTAPCIEFGSTINNEDIVYHVKDNGIGFNNDEAEGLFMPFHRLHSGGCTNGFGIGLATASRIVKRHGGSMWAEGKQGEGATFYFTL